MLGTAIDEALEGMRSGHGAPFGCVIEHEGEIVARGHNRVLIDNGGMEYNEKNMALVEAMLDREFDLP